MREETEFSNIAIEWRGAGLSTRTINALLNDGVHSWDDLRAHSGVELLRIPNLGRKGLLEIEAALKGRSMSLSSWWALKLADSTAQTRALVAVERIEAHAKEIAGYAARIRRIMEGGQ